MEQNQLPTIDWGVIVYRVPSRRKHRTQAKGPNLIPILDAVFIFIFFLLMSASFIKIYEIPSDVPIVSESSPPTSNKKPLALTLIFEKDGLILKRGVPAKTIGTFGKDQNGDYDLLSLRTRLIRIKKSFLSERTIIFEPRIDVNYEKLIQVMDAVRMFRKTDEALFIKDKKDGVDTKVRQLFSNIVFGNIQS